MSEFGKDTTPWKIRQRIVKNKNVFYVARTITEYTEAFERREDAVKLAEQLNMANQGQCGGMMRDEAALQ